MGALLAAIALAGCGWHPLYQSTSPGSARAELGRIAVGPLAERSGQLLRLALQSRLAGAGDQPIQYDLSVSFALRSEGIAIRQDNSTTRVRFIATADWKLIGRDPQHTTITSGYARDLDGLNVINQQYFAADLESEAVQRRMTEAVADQIARALAAYFDLHPSAA